MMNMMIDVIFIIFLLEYMIVVNNYE